MQLNFHRSGQGPVLLLTHGLFGSLENLGMVHRAMSEHFDVISIDLPDHGRSPRTEAFSFEGYSQLIIDLLDHLKISKVAIMGHSLGGKIAMFLALNHPTRVTRLAVADIAPVAYSPRHQQVLNGLNAVSLETIRDRKDGDKQMAEFIQIPGVRQFLLKSLQKIDQRWQWLFNLPLLERDYPLLSQGIEHPTPYSGPTLFIKGANSDYILAEHQLTIARLFPSSKARIIANTGHWLHAEKPHLFNRSLLQFLQG